MRADLLRARDRLVVAIREIDWLLSEAPGGPQEQRTLDRLWRIVHEAERVLHDLWLHL